MLSLTRLSLILSNTIPDKDRREWPEMFSVDQATKKEMIIGGVAQNPWKTLCNSVAECS